MVSDAEAVEQPQPKRRGVGKGGRFFALGLDTWELLWAAETTNRLNLASTFLVLLAGTGSDHRLTKWSAKACEQYLGMGKPRARRAIDELIAANLLQHTEASTPVAPQYQLPELPREAEPIFLPVQLVTGLVGETPILRRVRETGDAHLLRMLIDLYAQVLTDMTYGLPLENLRVGARDDLISRKLFEAGANSVWALVYGSTQMARGSWASWHHQPDNSGQNEEWSEFWSRVRTLQAIGALVFEPWIFDGLGLDAEPMFPVQLDALSTDIQGPVPALTLEAHMAAVALAGERTWVVEHQSSDLLLPLAAHQQAPAIRGVAKLRIEPDTPGRRRSYALRMSAVERYRSAYAQMQRDALEGRFDRPLAPERPEGGI